jgi:hypothetical protein
MFNTERYVLSDVFTYNEFITNDGIDLLNGTYGFCEEIPGSIRVMGHEISITSKGVTYKTNRIFYTDRQVKQNSLVERVNDNGKFMILNMVKIPKGQSKVYGYAITEKYIK